MADLTDFELRKQLKEHGMDVGPIMDSTRAVYVKKLNRLLSGEDSSPVPSTSQQSDAKNRRRSTPFRANKSQTSLGGFSSEESGSENATDAKKQQRRRRTLPPAAFATKPPASPLTINTTIRNSASNSGTTITSTFKRGNASETIGSFGRLTRARLERNNMNFEADFSDGEAVPSNSTHREYADFEQGVFPGLKSFSSKTFKWLSGSSNQNKVSSKPNYLNGHQPTTSRLNTEFITEEDPKSTTNYSQFISWFLLILVTIFFVTVGLLYIGVKQKESNISTSVKSFSSHLCKGFSVANCISTKEELKTALQMSHELHNYLSGVAGRIECGDGKIKERWVPLSVVKNILLHKMAFKDESELNDHFFNCMVLVRNHPEWGIKLLKVEGSDEIRALESVIASKPLFCRICEAINQVFRQLILSVLTIFISIGGFFMMKRYRQNKKEMEQQIYRYVERAVEILQKHHDLCQGNPQQDPRMAIVHVRDMIIPLAQRCDKSQIALWERSVKFINDNESRMRVETQQIAGEDFLVWRWLPLSNPEDFKKNKMWQGEAFEKSTNVPSFAPTPCLKIRNMFDPEVEYGEDWLTIIQDAILDKCDGNDGIVHIHIDMQSKEGCVYVKCKTLETAAQAYKALHGAWFDGNLVTVKYLRLERYHERFPDSTFCTKSLKPSNNMRLSLQSLRNPTLLENS